MITYSINKLPAINKNAIKKPLPADLAKDVLFRLGCHVDHEGFDLNEIEQYYYKYNSVELHHDNTWYKDGGQTMGTNSVLYDWIVQRDTNEKLIIDHSSIVVKYPITGEAADQLKKYSKDRPELLRMLSSNFKCGLDLCIDCYNEDRVEPIVHIEWDYDDASSLEKDKNYVESILSQLDWKSLLGVILRYNKLARINRISAFDQADFRSMLIFGKKSYNLIPTL